jgi:hypothetical protein
MSVFDPTCNSAQLARHLLESAQDGDSAVFDLDHVAETSVDSEDKDVRSLGEKGTDLLNKDFAGIIVPETGVDDFDVVTSA